MKDKLILTVHVVLDKEGVVGFENSAARVKMLPFAGTVEGDIFNGIVAPCGVDTQVTNRVGVRNMSAKYMLIGKDREGQDCHIFVDNEGYFTPGQPPKPYFETVPTFITDSKCLAPYLMRNQFRGEGHSRPDGSGPDILFFEVADED